MKHDRHTPKRRLRALRTLIADARDAGLSLTWGVILHAETSSGHLRATTAAGETLVLTHALLMSLSVRDCWIAGRRHVQVSSVRLDDAGPGPDEAVLHLNLATELGTGIASDHALIMDTILDAMVLHKAPVALLLQARPHGWPP
jgi:hypothetical protein